jgi:DNA-binding response OmpR family regulator
MKRILVIDDDTTLLGTLKRGLAYDGFAVDIASAGAEGLALARERSPDLVVLDVMMPGMDGWEVLARLRAGDARLPIVMLTAKDAPADHVRGLGGGADDYVVKPFAWEVLLARVHALLRRQDAERPPVLRFADLVLDTGERRARRGARDIDLTTTEYQLLRQFLEHPRRVLPRDFLMDRVWGYEFYGGTNVLETYVKQLRQKLEAEGEQRLIHTIRGAGYVLREA